EKKVKKPSSSILLPKEFQDLIGKETLPRNEIMKEIWDYIRANKLQDPNDKRTIIPDEKLSRLLGNNAPISMFQMTGKI
ncbi:SWIB/MDM2 domain-containing protein, partial [Acinetobacter baumannii]